jgi:peptidyl-dipeptidase Dcp
LSFLAVAALAAAFVYAASAADSPAAAPARANPFMSPSGLPLQAPPFDKIQDADYQPALEEGMKQQLAEVQKIADNSAPPSFDNTIVALEKTGQLLNRASLAFSAVSGANTDDALEKLQETEAPKFAATQDAINLNDKLFKRVQAVYDQRDTLKLDPESQRLLWYYHQQFVMAGANLSEADKAKLKELNGKDAELSAKFTNQVLAANKAAALVVSDKAELDGLSQGELDAAAAAAKARGLEGKWVIPIQNHTTQSALASLKNRATREKLFKAGWMRAEHGDANDTRATILQLAEIRAEKAKLLGEPNFASWRLQDQMAQTPAAVNQFLMRLAPAATARARTEAADIQALIDQQKGGFKLQPWDWDFYAQQVRKAKYDLDDNEIKPYFELNRVLQDGVFYAANQLYGLTFKERHDIPVYQPDVRVFDVFDKDGKQLGLFYCDYFKRDNKQGGAWMSNLVIQSKLFDLKPVVYNVANFTKPAAGQPALLSFDDVTTMFHEFGHALHGLFASGEYPSLSGAATPRDWVEFPSQFNEHWALNPKVFANYAKNYKTGEPMPQALVDKIKKASNFNQGYDMTELLAAAALDVQWHTLPVGAGVKDADQFETEALKRTGFDVPQVPTRYRSSYFLHIWGNGYSSAYYAYPWTQMLADDAFSWFDEHGGLTRENGDRFRAMILSRGNSEDLASLYKNFRGRAPAIDAMLKDRGLAGN